MIRIALARHSLLTDLLLSLTACVSKLNFLISKPTERVHGKLLGSLISGNERKCDERTHFAIGKFDDVRYEIVEHSYSDVDSVWSKQIYSMYIAKIENDIFS